MQKRLLAVASMLALTGTLLWFTTHSFHGVADADHLRVLDVERACTGEVATLVERSDDSALSGSDVFVLVSDRVYTMPELRKNFYALDPVFHVGDDRLVLSWVSGNELNIRCAGCAVTKEAVTTQKAFQAGVSIRYVDFP